MNTEIRELDRQIAELQARRDNLETPNRHFTSLDNINMPERQPLSTEVSLKEFATSKHAPGIPRGVAARSSALHNPSYLDSKK